ncbi:Cyclic nucleotide-gated ion channel 1 [Capsicum annuum]|uniref:Cyclic nucleotide-gated ion channel 1 n=1 Tax=Capsicum annuum TaxID=4072 RepID=A0A2G2ZX84_CAPAN|nr:Cyclic nucleotide-gated ion channel 1 [Capsicum annuum]KAF3644834.1 Cyclic nucleotide-gated ion channel 1 [Capsicum annuum]PHT86602.1 Cyclic nucleotide-gated ion channel 1 [Capsicum annuum]
MPSFNPFYFQDEVVISIGQIKEQMKLFYIGELKSTNVVLVSGYRNICSLSQLEKRRKAPSMLVLLKRVPMFEKMDEQLLDALCDCLKLALFIENRFIIREVDPMNEMLFLMRDNLLSMTTNDIRSGFFNSASLKAGDYYGEELLTWALDPNAFLTLPTSTRTVQVVIDVEAFSLTFDDLKFYSQHWRTWAAFFIQAAWRRHCRNKLEKSLREKEDILQAVLISEIANLPSLGLLLLCDGGDLDCARKKSITVRVEGMRLRRRDAEQWMSHRILPDNLRKRIQRYKQYKWLQTRGVDEHYLISDLLKDFKRDVPMFEKMDEQLLDALCDRLKPALFTENSFITREGNPMNEIVFLMRGNLLSMTTNGGRTGFFNSTSLKAVQVVRDVEGFALTSDDLMFVTAQFRCLHSKHLLHTFRFYSQHWRTWAACFIQVAWRRHCRNKLEKSLREEEDILQATLTNEIATLPSLGATIYASKFAANALRALRRNHPRHLVCKEKVFYYHSYKDVYEELPLWKIIFSDENVGRYRNFERLHRHLKDIPNYTLHLSPKRIFSSSTEDAFVHQRCIYLDKYLQDLLTIAFVADQYEVWDFLSASSKGHIP